jgi:hypothetical protein
MIRLLAAGKLHGGPVQRTYQNGKSFVTEKVMVVDHEPAVRPSVIAFDDAVVARLVTLRSGNSLALSGRAEFKTYESRDRTHRAGMSVIVDEIACLKLRPKARRNERAPGRAGFINDPLHDIGADG